MVKKPVIFLAFANDRVDNAAYLRNLPIELNGIREALQPAVKAGLCEVVERTNATIQQIIDVFQEEYYADRIAVFHYGGHANGYQLLLENLDGTHSSAHSTGLVSFFARQRGLQLVFLNGCSSQQQALDLVGAGIGAVIGTSQSINDDVATKIAIRFYKGLSTGKAIDRSWQEAIDEVKIEKGTDNMRDLFWEGGEVEVIDSGFTPDRFPWEIYYKPGAEVVKAWNLPEAVDNPLFGLPTVPEGNLPEEPYRFLERYKREHAEIFFGRSYFIRELFNRATDPKAAPIILFYGQSGVGKSSMLDAGLFPRLEQVCQVVYLRRDPKKGLLGTIRDGLGMRTVIRHDSEKLGEIMQMEAEIEQLQILINNASANRRAVYLDLQEKSKSQLQSLQNKTGEVNGGEEVLSLSETWKLQETTANKPLIVLLDQVEEIYTKPNLSNYNEIEEALEEVYRVFGDPKQRPQGKLILSYRKEYHPEIEEGFKKLQLPREKVFLRKLEERDIREVVMGLATSERVQRRYNINIEYELDNVIADDLLEDKDSPIAPVLQILLTKMWKMSAHEELHYFSVKKYQELKKQGILMDDFFHEQMRFLNQYYPEHAASGLALDILYFHTTKLGTANVHSLEELRERYGEREQQVSQLISEFKNLYLLSDAGIHVTGLAHDTLAPIVQDEFRHSDKPGQRASLILQNKAIAYEQNEETVLDLEDLRLVEEGAGGMRIWTMQEQALIEQSRERRRKLLAEQKRNKRIRIVGVAIIAFISVVASVLAFYANQQQKEATAQAEEAKKQTIKAEEQTIVANEATKKATRALADLKVQQDSLQISLQIAAAARDTAEVRRIEAQIAENRAKQSNKEAVIAKNQADEKRLTAEALLLAGMSKEWLTKENPSRALSLSLMAYNKAEESKAPIPSTVYQSMMDAYYYGWGEEKQQNFYNKVMKAHTLGVHRMKFSPDGTRLITASVGYEQGFGEAILWDGEGNFITKFTQNLYASMSDYELIKMRFSPDSKSIVALGRDMETLFLIDEQGKTQKEIKVGQFIKKLGFLPNENNFYAIVSSGYEAGQIAKILIWSQEGELLSQITDQKGIKDVLFPENANWMLTISDASYTGDVDVVWLRDRKTSKVIYKVVQPTKDTYFEVGLLPNQKQFTIQNTLEGDTWVYDLPTGRLIDSLNTKFRFAGATAIPQSENVVSGGEIWNTGDSIYAITSLNPSQSYFSFDISPKENLIATGSEHDGMIVLWDGDGKKVKEIKGHEDGILDLKFTPDGDYFVTVSRDKTAALWNKNLEKLQEFKGHAAMINSIAFTPDGTRFLTGSLDQSIIVWDLVMEKPKVKEGRKHIGQGQESSSINTICFTPDGERLMTLGYSNAFLWEEGNDEPIAQIKSPKNIFSSKAKYALDGSRLALSTEYGDSTIALYDGTGGLLKTFDKSIAAVAFSNNGKHIAIVEQKEIPNPNGNSMDKLYSNGTVKVCDWNGENAQTIATIEGYFHHLTFSPDNRYILTRSKGKEVVLDLKGNLINTLAGNSTEVFMPAFASNQPRVVIFSSDYQGTIWNTETWESIGTIDSKKYHGGDAKRVAISSDGTRIATGSWSRNQSKAVALWDGAGNYIATLDGVDSNAGYLEFSPNGEFLLVTWNSKAGLWNKNGQFIKRLPIKNYIGAVAFSPDGKYILVGDNSGALTPIASVETVIANVQKDKTNQMPVVEKLELGLPITIKDTVGVRNPMTKLAIARDLMKQEKPEGVKEIYQQIITNIEDIALVKGILSDKYRYGLDLDLQILLTIEDEGLLREYGQQLLLNQDKLAASLYEQTVLLNPSVANIWNLQQVHEQLKTGEGAVSLLRKLPKTKDYQELLAQTKALFNYQTALKNANISIEDASDESYFAVWKYAVHYVSDLLKSKEVESVQREEALDWAGYYASQLAQHISNTQEGMGWAIKAIDLKEQVISIKTNDYRKATLAEAYSSYAVYLLYVNQLERALSYAKKGNELIAQNTQVLISMGHVYTAKGMSVEAQGWYTKAKATYENPDDFLSQIADDLAKMEKEGVSKSSIKVIRKWLE